MLSVLLLYFQFFRKYKKLASVFGSVDFAQAAKNPSLGIENLTSDVALKHQMSLVRAVIGSDLLFFGIKQKILVYLIQSI